MIGIFYSCFHPFYKQNSKNNVVLHTKIIIRAILNHANITIVQLLTIALFGVCTNNRAILRLEFIFAHRYHIVVNKEGMR